MGGGYDTMAARLGKKGARDYQNMKKIKPKSKNMGAKKEKKENCSNYLFCKGLCLTPHQDYGIMHIPIIYYYTLIWYHYGRVFFDNTL